MTTKKTTRARPCPPPPLGAGFILFSASRPLLYHSKRVLLKVAVGIPARALVPEGTMAIGGCYPLFSSSSSLGLRGLCRYIPLREDDIRTTYNLMEASGSSTPSKASRMIPSESDAIKGGFIYPHQKKNIVDDFFKSNPTKYLRIYFIQKWLLDRLEPPLPYDEPPFPVQRLPPPLAKDYSTTQRQRIATPARRLA